MKPISEVLMALLRTATPSLARYSSAGASHHSASSSHPYHALVLRGAEGRARTITSPALRLWPSTWNTTWRAAAS